MFTTALFTRAQRWKQSKCPSMDGLMDKQKVVHPHKEYYSTLKRKQGETFKMAEE